MHIKIYEDGSSEPTILDPRPGPFASELSDSGMVLLADGTLREVRSIQASITVQPETDKRYAWVEVSDPVGTVPVYIANLREFWQVGTKRQGLTFTPIHEIEGKQTIGYFDSPDKAQVYMSQMGLGPEWSVIQMDTREFIAWLRHYVGEGVTQVAWNPGPGARIATIFDILIVVEGVGEAARRKSPPAVN